MFKYTQPKTQTDIKCRRDCMIRSVVIATNTEYKTVHKLMYDYGWRATRNKSKNTPEEIMTKTLISLGYSVERISYPAVKGFDRMTGKKLIEENESGTFIIRVPKHVACIKDGVLMDTWDCSNKCVYFVWKITKNN